MDPGPNGRLGRDGNPLFYRRFAKAAWDLAAGRTEELRSAGYTDPTDAANDSASRLEEVGGRESADAVNLIVRGQITEAGMDRGVRNDADTLTHDIEVEDLNSVAVREVEDKAETQERVEAASVTDDSVSARLAFRQLGYFVHVEMARLGRVARHPGAHEVVRLMYREDPGEADLYTAAAQRLVFDQLP